MTILLATGEDAGVTFIGTARSGAASNSARSGYARSTSTGLTAQNSSTVADPPGNRIQPPSFTAGNTIWFHAQVWSSVTTSTNNQHILLFRSPDGVSRLILRNTGTFGTWKMSSRNSAGTITDLITFSASGMAASTIGSLDIKIDYSSSGSIQAWFAGVSLGTYSGDPRTDAATQLYQVEFASINNNASLDTTVWSEIIVADEDTRGMALWTLNPQAAGNTQSWTPNTLANINKQTINDSTSIATSSNNALSQWTTPTSAPSGSWAVKCIVQEARVKVGATGPQHFDWSLRTASTDYTAGVSNAPTTSFSNFADYIWASNPSTLSDWAIGDIASGFNLGIKSLA